MAQVKFRIAADSMGEMKIPADMLHGASTQRAVLNFPVSGRRFPRPFIYAIAQIKASAARANLKLGRLKAKEAGAIIAAVTAAMPVAVARQASAPSNEAIRASSIAVVGLPSRPYWKPGSVFRKRPSACAALS